jgi:hypothetical protein
MKELVRVISKKRDESDCISAAPAALDRYLAAQPAMSLIPFAPFTTCGKFGSDPKLLAFAQLSKADPDINSADLNC